MRETTVLTPTEEQAAVASERVLEGDSIALRLLFASRSITVVTDRLYLGMAYLCGILLLLLGLFITYQVIARKAGFIMAGGTDQMSGYVLALAATWGFSHALRTGTHVRIDVVLPFMPKKLRAVADWVALGSIAFLASVTSWKVWVMVLKSWSIGAVSNTYPLTPLWLPQSVIGIGFSILAFTSIQMMVNNLGEGFLPWLHKLMGGTESYRLVSQEVSPGDELPTSGF